MVTTTLKNTDGLKLSDKNVESISTNSNIKVTNNLERIRSFIDDGTRITMGQLEYNALINGNAIAYFCGDFGSDDSLESKLLTHLYQLQSLLMTTWLTQDNSINFDNGFALLLWIMRVTSNVVLIKDSTPISKPVTLFFSNRSVRSGRN